MGAQREDVLIRSNGQRVAFSEYGDVHGAPVIFCHGWPSSRMMAELTDTAARELSVRIISPDRPGIGDSSFVADRRLLDWPPLVGELADHLELPSFRVLGISGGAPYAYATGLQMPERVCAIAVVSGAPDVSKLSDHTGLLPLYRLMLRAYDAMPGLSRCCFRMARPLLSLRPPRRSRSILLRLLQPCDAESLEDESAFQACFESQRRAWKGSAEGVLTDAEIYARPWGFGLNEVRIPVRLWHGSADRSFSAAIARKMAAELPNCTAFFLEEAGHYSTPIRHTREILRDLISV